MSAADLEIILVWPSISDLASDSESRAPETFTNINEF